MHTSHSTIIDQDLQRRLADPRERNAAFAAFYDLLARYVYAYALRMTSSASDAADITQDTFIRVHAHLVRGNSIVDPLPFCLMIARQRVLNLHRDHKQTVELDDEHIVGDAHDDVFSADLRQHIEREVSRLPLLLRDAFVLRYYDGLSYDAIATMISESAGTVRMRVQRAKAILRRTLAHLANEVDT